MALIPENKEYDEASRVFTQLVDVVQAVVDWNTEYPSSRIYCESEIRKIAAEMDVIFEKAKVALADAQQKEE